MITFLENAKINRSLVSFRPMLVCVLGITLFTIPCNAQSTKPSSATDTANASGDKVASKEPKEVCRSVEKTGTRFKSRICKQQVEWDAIDNAEIRSAGEYTRKTNERSAATSSTAPGGDAYMGGGTTATSQ